ncbi:MAG TPA: hypothetical protein VGS10_12470 [Terracidiphilus sp.]|nr:hypothetical protein [Terracidiphilus sp.]
MLAHLLTHSIRHCAQLATLTRHHGVAPGWSMDYIMSARHVKPGGSHRAAKELTKAKS